MSCVSWFRSGRLRAFAVVTAAAVAAACSHSTAPTASSQIFSPMTVTFARQHVSQGDTLVWTVTLPGPASAVVGDQLVLAFSGAAIGADTVSIAPDVYGYNFGLIVPASIPDGTLMLTVTVPAVGQTAQATVQVDDKTPPMFDSAGMRDVAMPNYNNLTDQVTTTGDLLIGAGLPDTLRIWASDNHALAWVGFALGAPVNIRDSVTVTGAAAEADFPLALPSSAAGSGAPLTVFMRDADGNVATDTLGLASVITFNQHPVHSAPVQDTITDLAIDTKRGLVYLAQPDSGRVAVLSLATMTYHSPIPFMGRPVSLDLTPGGDSLLVALDSTSALAVVQLTGSPQLAGSIPVPADPNALPATLVYRVRVAADGHAIVTMRMPNLALGDTGYAAQSLTLATDSTVAGVGGPLSAYMIAPPPSARSGDGSVVVAMGAGGLGYNATTKQYVQGGGTWPGNKPFWLSEGNSGTGVAMLGHLVSIPGATASLGSDTLYGSAVASNGTAGYVAESSCGPSNTVCADTAAGSLVEYRLGLWYAYNNMMFPEVGRAANLASLPRVAQSLVVSPDNKTVIAIGGKMITAVDLTTSIAPSASSARHLQRLVVAHAAHRPMVQAAATTGSAWDLHAILKIHAVHR
jgi:hypothetical protein